VAKLSPAEFDADWWQHQQRGMARTAKERVPKDVFMQ
jgi:hypothetical protein